MAEFEQYLKLKELTLDAEELDERQKVIDWLGKTASVPEVDRLQSTDRCVRAR